VSNLSKFASVSESERDARDESGKRGVKTNGKSRMQTCQGIDQRVF
jgi:hypothetical protein